MGGSMNGKKMLYFATLGVLLFGLSLTGCSKKEPDASQVTGTEGAGLTGWGDGADGRTVTGPPPGEVGDFLVNGS